MKSGFVRYCLAVAFCSSLAACDYFTGPRSLEGLVVRTSADRYFVTTAGVTSVRIEGEVVNNSNSVVYLRYCGHRVEKLVGTGWTGVWQLGCAAVDGVDSRIQPGNRSIFGVQLRDQNDASFPRFDFSDTNALYRVVLPMYTRAENAEQPSADAVDDDIAASNPFRIIQ